MHRPFDLTVVDTLVANSLKKAIENVSHECADEPRRAEMIAAQILCKASDAGLTGYDGSVHLIAGFRLAMSLCCRVLADPMRVHRAGVRRDVAQAKTWLEEWRQDLKRSKTCDDAPEISLLVTHTAA